MGAKIQLIYGPYTLELGVPTFGNTDSVEHTRINRETRAGDLIIFRDPLWPVVEILAYKMEDLSQQQIKDFLDFIDLTLGKDITLIDHHGIGWVGMIVNPEAAGEQTGRGCGGFDTELKFEGNRVA